MRNMKKVSLGLALVGAFAAPSAMAVTAPTTGSAYIVTPLRIEIWHPLHFGDISKGAVDSQVQLSNQSDRAVLAGDAVLLPAINSDAPSTCRGKIYGDTAYQFELQMPQDFYLDAGNKLKVHSFTTNLPNGFGAPTAILPDGTFWRIGATLDIPADAPLGLQSAALTIVANYI